MLKSIPKSMRRDLQKTGKDIAWYSKQNNLVWEWLVDEAQYLLEVSQEMRKMEIDVKRKQQMRKN